MGKPESWGGVILLGKAPVKGSPASIEGLVGDQFKYGGGDVGDSSGTLKYVRVWGGGERMGADNEINGITFGGVGSGTSVEYCEVALKTDDGFEFFGGTVNAKYLSSIYGGDDAFDTDKQYQGKMQFLFAMIGKNGHHGAEMDGDKSDGVQSAPQVMSWTVVGSSNAKEDAMIKLREGTAGAFGNVVLEPKQKCIGIKNEVCKTGDGVSQTQVAPSGSLAGKTLWWKDFMYISAKTLMHEVSPSTFLEKCSSTKIPAKATVLKRDPNLVRAGAITAQITLDTDFDTIKDKSSAAYTKFETDFKTDVAKLLKVTTEQIIVKSIKAGSVVVDFVVNPAIDGTKVTASNLATAFKESGKSIAGAKTTTFIKADGSSAAPTPTPTPNPPPPTPAAPPAGSGAFIAAPMGVLPIAVLLCDGLLASVELD